MTKIEIQKSAKLRFKAKKKKKKKIYFLFFFNSYFYFFFFYSILNYKKKLRFLFDKFFY